MLEFTFRGSTVAADAYQRYNRRRQLGAQSFNMQQRPRAILCEGPLFSGSRRLASLPSFTGPIPLSPLPLSSSWYPSQDHSLAAGREDRSGPGVRKSTPERHPPPRVFFTSTPGRSRILGEDQQDGRTRSSRFLLSVFSAVVFFFSFSLPFYIRNYKII